MTVALKNQNRTKGGALDCEMYTSCQRRKDSSHSRTCSPAYPGDGYVGLASHS